VRAIIVDDEELARGYLRELLGAHAEIEIVGECVNGFEAVKSISEFHPDLVFLDVKMPKLDGFEVCRQLKSEPETAGIKVVILSARGADTDRARGREAGADDYFIKPFSPVQLLNKVYALLE